MKRLFVVTIAAIALITNHHALAHGNSNPPDLSAPPVHSGSAPAPMPAPAAVSAPHLNGIGHPYNGSPYSYHPMPYRPVITYHNGARTLTYPAVGNSINHRSTQSTIHSSTVHTTHGSQHTSGGGSQGSSTKNAVAKRGQLDSQTAARLRNWKGNVSTAAQAHQNNANNSHHHHDHDWWHHHCVAFIFWDWGWWGWDDGWWYPAWGYAPYSDYEYQAPIYGDLAPAEIVADVQTALQQLGYYTYAVDGQMGPLTRSALNRYQSDNRLPITSGLDPATLGSLGIIH
ncbi:MAG TPA: peptidoglycan-binding domain-containing protein [Chthoniobacterales bacterium]|nr:peptidoglycan-binding domain-containing protein [Chthoniobacterales bacterium]